MYSFVLQCTSRIFMWEWYKDLFETVIFTIELPEYGYILCKYTCTKVAQKS